MKEQAIQKINKVGKISAVVTLVCKILVIFGMITCVAGLVLCLALPKDLIKVTTSGTMLMETSYGAFGIEIPEEEIEKMNEMQDALERGEDIMVETVHNGVMGGNLTFTSTGQTYFPTAVEITDKLVRMDMEAPEVVVTLRSMVGLLLLASICMVMTLVTLVFIGNLCKAFRDCTSPFEENVIKKMQHLAYVLIPWTVSSSIGNSVLTSAMSG